ncbi:MAG: phosphotransferase [Candidatus Binatia bacterium]|nr:phosphotransferase [Candidatus Binatia bacterium]
MATDDNPQPWSEAELGRLLGNAGVLDASDPASDPAIEPAGDGNINWVRRIRSRESGHTVIVKHARPALEKFPEYETSTERIVFENRYYEIARPLDTDGICPNILRFDEARRLLVLEDLGDAERLDAAFLRGADVERELVFIARFLGRVHSATWEDDTLAARFANQDIQRLHGDHIFKLPYEGDGFPVPSGVESRAAAVRSDRSLAKTAAHAYERYLSPHGALVHADVQPGNILLHSRSATLLDAEIAHVGDPAFDVGTLLAHTWISGPVDHARRSTAAIWEAYTEVLGDDRIVAFEDAARYAGLEIMRRTIGAARVAAVASAASSLAAIELADRLIREPPTRLSEAFTT